MIMKVMKINILAAGALMTGLLLVTSCSESWLDVESATESNSDNYFQTESDAYRALVGCYAGWRETTSDGGITIYQTSMMMSDECFAGAGMSDATNYNNIDEFDMSNAPSYTSMWETDWASYYTCINRCNDLIIHESQITWDDETVHQTYMGEVYGLRALCYFDMVRMFENIPLLTEPSSDNIPQADPDSVYALIFSDLKYAIENIPADAYPKANASSNEGHVTRYGAEAILARAYLYYKGRFGKEPSWCTQSEALEACEDIIASGEYALVPVFKNLWPASSSSAFDDVSSYEEWLAYTTYAGIGNEEWVLTMKCNNTQDYDGNNDGNRWVINLGIRGISSIDCSPYGYGWGICTVNPELVDAFPEGDQRLEASIIDIDGEGISEKSGFEDACIADQREYTGYYVKKYTPMASTSCTSLPLLWGSDGDVMTSQWQDVVVVRYSDVLLMAAELGSDNAQDYFNQVRERAYTEEDGTLNANYSQKSATTANILEERRLEFCFEGLRYYDLLRQGIDVAAAAIATSQSVLNGGNEATVTIQAANVIEKDGLCQIPNNQITLSNNVLVQNAGW